MLNTAHILDEFLLEAQEIFDQLDADLVRLETAPQDKKLLGSIFRALHTLKGSSGFFAFVRLEKVAHAGESLLTKLREDSLVADTRLTDALLASLDCLRTIVRGIAAQRAEPAGDDTALLQRLWALAEGRAPEAALPLSSAPAPAVQAVDGVPSAAQPRDGRDNDNDNDIESDGVIEGEFLLPQAANAFDRVAPIKVSVEALDTLMNLVSEMVLARNRLLSFTDHRADAQFASTVRTIDLITLELQIRVMKTRMQPISSLWSKFPRLVRDMAQDCGKKVQLVQIGAQTELDRTLLDAIRDPLIHILRNSVDHGIEPPAQRLARGKSDTGTVSLRSLHENGMVVIEIADDGAGVDLALVAQTAVAKGLLTPERAARMTQREILDFIYLPGFSTKAAVTHWSGRGVGLDVVRTHVQQIGGSVDMRTSPEGTTLRLQIPLTLAILPALFVQCAQQRFAIAQNHLLEMIRLEPADPRVEDFYGVSVFRLRDTLIPLAYLQNELALVRAEPDADGALHVVVVQAADLVFGLVVDKVLFMQEVVVKSAGPLLKGNALYSGVTILGDGQVALILDVAGLALRSGLASKLAEKDFRAELHDLSAPAASTQPMLLFDLPCLPRIAIALDYVDRLETFAANKVEQRGNHDVLVYGAQILRLVWLSDFVEGAAPQRAGALDTLTVIVHYHQGQALGLVVQRIHDIVHIAPEIILVSPRQQGLVGSAIFGEQVLSILDMQEILRLCQTGAASQPAQQTQSAHGAPGASSIAHAPLPLEGAPA